MNYQPPPRLNYVEQSIIGKLLLQDYEEILSRVYLSDFFHKGNKDLYEAINQHYLNFGSISSSIIYDKAEVMGFYKANDLQTFKIQAEEEDTDALILELKDFVTRRDQHKIISDALKDLYDPKKSSKDIYSSLTRGVTSLSLDLEIEAHTMTEIKQKIETENLGERLKVSEMALNLFYDKVGLHTYQTEVHVARSKHGKTTYACYKTAQLVNNGYKGVYFTLEGSRFDIYENLEPQIYPDKFDNLMIIDNAQTGTEISAKIYELKLKYNIDFVVVDYIQRVQSEGIGFADETPRVAKASIDLTNSALHNGVYMLVLAQPRKAGADRRGWNLFPTIDDIYGSGQIVKDAYCVTAGFRPLIAGNLLYKHTSLDKEGVLSYNGKIMPKNTYFVRMLLCRKGEMSGDTLRFLQEGTVLQLTRESGDHEDDYIKVQ